jgi:hypothetical protein
MHRFLLDACQTLCSKGDGFLSVIATHDVGAI